MTTNAKLVSIMVSQKLTRAEVSLLTRSTVYAVDSWLRDTTSDSFRAMPLGKLELMTMKLKGAQGSS